MYGRDIFWFFSQANLTVIVRLGGTNITQRFDQNLRLTERRAGVGITELCRLSYHYP